MTAVYQVTMGSIKISILTLYLRLFPHPTFRRVLYGCIVVIVCLMLSTTAAVIGGCRPVSAIWSLDVHAGKCVPRWTLQLVISILGLVTDVVILLLPLPIILTLSMAKHKKLEVLGIFSIGSLAVVASAIRISTIHFLSTSQDPTWDGYALSVWSAVELNIGMICASLLAIKPLFKSGKNRLTRYARSVTGTRTGRSQNRTARTQEDGLSKSETAVEAVESRQSMTPKNVEDLPELATYMSRDM